MVQDRRRINAATVDQRKDDGTSIIQERERERERMRAKVGKKDMKHVSPRYPDALRSCTHVV